MEQANIEIEIDKELDMTVFTVAGEIPFTRVLGAVKEYYKGKLTKYTLWDFSGADLAKYFTGAEARELGSLVSVYGKNRPGGFDLIIVTGLLPFGLARMYAAYADMSRHDPLALKAMVFRSKGAALDWVRKNETLK